MGNIIENAIARSISHREIVRIEAPHLFPAYQEARIISGAANHTLNAECDYFIENDGSYDVYGKTEVGEEFRLRLVRESKN